MNPVTGNICGCAGKEEQTKGTGIRHEKAVKRIAGVPYTFLI